MPGFLLDENLSRKLVDRLSAVLPSITHVALYGLVNEPDKYVWDFAKERALVIITKDYDFSDMSRLYGCPPKVIKLNCGNKTTDYISDMLSARSGAILDFSDGENCYMEVF
jgi:predicted nuclease of predicted toxin-antitoxin system